MVGEINPNHCVWSPLDSQLACNTRNGGLILYTPADSKIQVVLPSGSGVKSVAWSPDGGWLAFAKRESRDEEAPTYPGLWRVKVDGSEAGEILANSIPAQETLYLAQWTPDGEHILFWRGPYRVSWKDGLPLFRIFVDGGEPVQLPDPALGYDELRATSPNGRWMAIVLGLWRDVSANKQIWLLRADGTPERKLSDEDRSDLWPVWSPDGELLAYVSLPIPPGYEAMETNDPDVSGRRLWVMKNDGSEKKQLTDDPGYADEWPMWGSDGEHLVFVRRSLNRNSSEIWAYNLATYQLSPMVQGPSLPMKHYGYIHWSAVLDWHAGSLDSK